MCILYRAHVYIIITPLCITVHIEPNQPMCTYGTHVRPCVHIEASHSLLVGTRESGKLQCDKSYMSFVLLLFCANSLHTFTY